MDADRNSDAFENYRDLYVKWPWNLFDFDNLKKDNNGIYIKSKEKKELEKIWSYNNLKSEDKENVLRIGLSGDTDFGMKYGRNDTFFNDEIYRVCKSFFLDKLEKMNKTFDDTLFDDTLLEMMHSQFNFSLMLMQGGMNRRKGNFRDRFPEWVYMISVYYTFTEKEEKEEYVKKELLSTTDNISNVNVALSYLDLFGSFKGYYINTYFFGEETPEIIELMEGENGMIKYGKKRRNNNIRFADSVKDYCDFAWRYWEIRNKLIEKKKEESSKS